MERTLSVVLRHLYIANFKNGFWKSARRHLCITHIKYFSEAVIPGNINLMR